MEKIKVIKSHPVYINLFLFVCMGVILVALQLSLQSNVSIFSKSFFLNLLFNQSLIFILCLTLLLTQIFNKHLVIPIYRFYVVVISFTVFQGLFLDFNKVILILLCGYITISYIFDQLMKTVSTMACYSSRYNLEALWPPTVLCPQINIKINDQSITTNCINWDASGVMVKFQESDDLEKCFSQMNLDFNYKEGGQEIQLTGQIVSFSHKYKILGILITKESTENVVTWRDLLDIWNDRGVDPEWVR